VLENRLAGWPRPSLAHLAGTWLGALDAQVLLGWDSAPTSLEGLSEDEPRYWVEPSEQALQHAREGINGTNTPFGQWSVP